MPVRRKSCSQAYWSHFHRANLRRKRIPSKIRKVSRNPFSQKPKFIEKDGEKPNNEFVHRTGKVKADESETAVELSTEGKFMKEVTLNAEKSNHEFEDNPLGLKNKAEGWLIEEVSRVDPTLYSYHTGDSPISKEHVANAKEEYQKRTEQEDKEEIPGQIHPVLVALGLSQKAMKSLIDGGTLGKGQFLYFPTLTLDGKQQGALFLIYLAGGPHGRVNEEFIECVGDFRKGKKRILAAAVDSGDNDSVQPDWRSYPQDQCRNHDDRDGDNDIRNDMGGHTRIFWECEYQNRKIVELRSHGKVLMDQTEYARIFVGCKFSKKEKKKKDTKPTFEMAVVVWGKNEANEIEVLSAVSFGSRHLCEKSFTDWSVSDDNMLPPVRREQWRRPNNADDEPWKSDDDEPENNDEWRINISVKSIMYKVSVPNENVYINDRMEERNGKYFYNNREMTDLQLNLWEMAYQAFLKKEN